LTYYERRLAKWHAHNFAFIGSFAAVPPSSPCMAVLAAGYWSKAVKTVE
jgi:hypothetical protein